MELSQQPIPYPVSHFKSSWLKKTETQVREYFSLCLQRIKAIGGSETLEEYELRKLGIFNLINFFQFLSGLLIPLAGGLFNRDLPAGLWLVSSLPAIVCLLVLYLNNLKQYQAAMHAYFFGYPFITCVVYMYGMNPGTTLSFILIGILSVFFLKETGYMLFSLAFSMVSYFALAVLLKDFHYPLDQINKPLFLLNQGLLIIFIFYALYLLKIENANYQHRLLLKSNALQQKNQQIQSQADRLSHNACLLKKQAEELTELNALKNKLFSIISHDLKAPIHAVGSLFSDVCQRTVSIQELEKMLPEVVKDITYTTELMDNLLHWAKCQMKSDAVNPEVVDVVSLSNEVCHLLKRQADIKQIKMRGPGDDKIFAFGDKNMLSLVIRNLVSNAIKFTPENGEITVLVLENNFMVEIEVRDNGTGISQEAMQKIHQNDFYTTKGTASESGTGLGLMLCREFLNRNNSKLHVESETGTGTAFSFSLPRCSA
jgi:two-component system, sensor histidine kinase and response regulator